MIPEPWIPLFFTRIGDIFMRMETAVFWLESGTGFLKKVADSEEEFHRLMQSEAGELWLMAPVVQALHDAGKVAQGDQCYWFLIPPVFKDGLYTVENMFVAPAREVVTLSASMHEQLRDLPDGATVQIKVVD